MGDPIQLTAAQTGQIASAIRNVLILENGGEDPLLSPGYNKTPWNKLHPDLQDGYLKAAHAALHLAARFAREAVDA